MHLNLSLFCYYVHTRWYVTYDITVTIAAITMDAHAEMYLKPQNIKQSTSVQQRKKQRASPVSVRVCFDQLWSDGGQGGIKQAS